MKPDIRLNNDSVEVEGPLKLKRIIGETAVTGGLTVVNLEEHIANGFTHLVLKPESLVFETFHQTAGVKRFDVKKEIVANAEAVKKVAADLQALLQRTSWKVNDLRAASTVTVGPPVESLPANTPFPQLVLSANKIAVRTVVQPAPIKIPGMGSGAPQMGDPARPVNIVTEFDLVAENRALKQKVGALEQKVNELERRLAALESKVK